MTNLQIDRALALAIGWKPEQIRLTAEFGTQVAAKNVRSAFTSDPWWRGFNHLDPAVIWPIAERFDCFPWRIGDKWVANIGVKFAKHSCAATAVALAVIEANPYSVPTK